MSLPVCFSIAGSDPSGGAGIQADLKTFSALGCYASAAPSVITVQNTLGVTDVVPLPADLVYRQAEAVCTDLRPAALKIGMVGTAATVEALCRLIDTHKPPFVVLDPILVSSSGRLLLPPDAAEAMTADLFPRCTLVTPNLPEMQAIHTLLQGHPAPAVGTAADIRSPQTAIAQAQALVRSGKARQVLLKGGHLATDASDHLVTAAGVLRYPAPRLAARATHGTGCTLSSAIAAYVAKGHPLPEAIAAAKDYLTGALRQADALGAGSGRGSLHHFHNLYPA